MSAIDEDDPEHIADELGDVLLQVVFHAHIGKTYGNFSMGDIATAVCQKMIYRHEHIFGDTKCDTAQDVSDNWDKLKQAERNLQTQTSWLQDVPKGLPSLMRAAKVQKKAAKAGLGEPKQNELLQKFTEKVEQLTNMQGAAEEQLGNLLFDCVRVCRARNADPEMLLRDATDRFIQRFERMEKQIISEGKTL